MKWVKANERLPEFWDSSERHYRVDGRKVDGGLLTNTPNDKTVFEYKTSKGYIQTDNWELIEWLDESTPEVSAEAVVAKNYELVFSSQKYLNKVNKDMDELWVIPAMHEYASLVSASKDEEIARLKEDVKAEREPAGKLMEALVAILKEPYGFRFCDSGKLRKPNNPAKDHDYDCGYLLAKTAINEYNNKP